MTPELAGLAIVFDATHRLLPRSLAGLTPAQARERREGANPILWIAAHLVSVRAGFARGLGVPVDVPWAGQFPRGGKVEDVTQWPAIEEVLAAWERVHTAFMARLDTLTAGEVAAKTPLSGLDDTLLGAIALAALHDAYHMGQLAAARRAHGLDRLVG